MQTLPFDNGDRMPALGLGTWKSTPGEVGTAVGEALRLGYRHVDCAPIYGNEGEIGVALEEALRDGVLRREELWVTSKLWNDRHAPEDVRPALEQTLADLRLEYLDLLLMHWPVALRKGTWAPESADDCIPLEALPLEVTWSAMGELVDAGLCRHVGVSNFSVPKLERLAATGRRPELNQVELHPYLQQPAMLAWAREHGVHVTAYSPLGSPDRPRRMKEEGEPVLMEDPAITAIAERRGITPAQVLLAWALQRGTAAVPKSVSSARQQENLAAAEIELEEEDMRAIAALDRHRRYVHGAFWAVEGGPYTVAGLWDE